MVLKYNFEYISNNNTLVNFLTAISDESNIAFEIIRNNHTIEFYVSGDNEELAQFSDLLSKELPMSIFLKNTDVEVLEHQITPKDSMNIQPSLLSFCPKCMSEVQDNNSADYYNPFFKCPRCSQIKNKKLVQIQDGIAQEINDYPEFFKALAAKINQGLKVKIETQSGSLVFAKMNLQTEQTGKILCTNLMNLSHVFVAKKSEVVALASIEKPQIKLHLNEVFKQKEQIGYEALDVRYANDLLLHLLSNELQKCGIDFLQYSCEEHHDIEIQTGFLDDTVLDIPYIKILPNEQLIMLESDSFDDSLTQMYNKFEDKNKGHFMVLLQENNLFDKSIVNFYASSLDDDNISVYNNNIGSFLDILNYELPSSMKEVFEQIQSDDTGRRLFENYSNKFPQNIDKALSLDMQSIQKHSIVSLWKIVRVLLGFETTVLNHATVCMLEKGPRLDYKLFKQEKVYNQKFDFIKLLRSGMSYKLAGVDDNSIALGYVESYAHFIAHIVDEVNNDIPLDGISLCGDIFSNNLISNFVHKSITKNYKIYYNKDFVIQVS